MSTGFRQHSPGFFLLCLTLFLSVPAQAEFITDKVVVKVHAERFGQGAVLKTLSSGTTITVLMNEGNYSRIRTSDNVTGWVESKYITNEKPTQLEYLELLSRSKTLEARLKTAEEKLSAQPASEAEGIDLTELAELRKRAADAGWMRVELKKTRDRVNSLESKLKSSSQNTSSAEGELNQLREQNKILEERLAAAVLVNEQQEIQPQEPAETTTPEAPEKDAMAVSIEWFLGSIVIAVIIGLIAGMIWLDKRIRQRHGGFRIY